MTPISPEAEQALTYIRDHPACTFKDMKYAMELDNLALTNILKALRRRGLVFPVDDYDVPLGKGVHWVVKES